MPISLPLTPEDLTPEWLTLAFQEGGVLTGLPVVHEVATERIGEDRGMVGITVRLRLTGDNVPATVVAKLSMAAREVRERMRAIGVYEREVRFYTELRPCVDSPTPAAYFAAYNPAENASVILLEDLAGCRFPDDGAATVDEVARMFAAIVPAHAAFWGRSDLPRWLTFADAGNELSAARIDGRTALYEERMGGIEPWMGRVIDLLPQALRSGKLEAGEPATLIHGDFSVKNVALTGSSLWIFDWQLAGCRPAIRDVQTAIVRSLPGEDAVRALDELLGHYRKLMRSYGIELRPDSTRRGFFQSLVAGLSNAGGIVVAPPNPSPVQLATSRHIWNQAECFLPLFDPFELLA